MRRSWALALFSRDAADAYPAAPATPRHHPKLTASFSPQTRNATCGSPHFAQRKMIFRDNGQQAKLGCKGTIAFITLNFNFWLRNIGLPALLLTEIPAGNGVWKRTTPKQFIGERIRGDSGFINKIAGVAVYCFAACYKINPC